MTERQVWMKTKGLAIDTGKLTFDVQDKKNKRIGTLSVTETSLCWRSAHKRRRKVVPISWERFDEIMQAAAHKDS